MSEKILNISKESVHGATKLYLDFLSILKAFLAKNPHADTIYLATQMVSQTIHSTQGKLFEKMIESLDLEEDEKLKVREQLNQAAASIALDPDVQLKKSNTTSLWTPNSKLIN